ncbi:adenosine receptor A3-like [Oculina patagonica]
MSNVSDEGRKEMFREFICTVSEGKNDKETAIHYILISSVCIFLTITATLENSLILVALHKDTSLHPPSKILLRSLEITDLCVGVIGQPVTIASIFSALFQRTNLCRVTQILAQFNNTIFSGVSLLTVTAISVDRLLALLLRLRYRQVVSVKRVRAAVFLFWIITIAVAILNYFLFINFYFLTTVSACIVLLLLISVYSYTRIFHTIRRQQQQVQNTLGSTGINIARYKKTVFNALWVHLTLIVCYLPFALVSGLLAVHGFSSTLFLAQFWAFTLVYLNSSLNPVLYCWKIKEVRQSVKETIRQLFTRLTS